jgi:hypothetical protein
MNDLGLDLDLGMTPRTRGRAAKPVTVSVVRELEVEDLEYLNTVERGSVAPPIKSLRARHHALAKCLAQGMSDGDAAIMCNSNLSRVSILKGDPAFQELVSYYRKGVEDEYYGMHEQLAGIAKDALGELSDRLEEHPDDFSVGQLMELGKMGADRTGFGPTSKTQVDVRHGLADKLDAARKRTLELRKPSIIEGEAIELKDVTPASDD